MLSEIYKTLEFFQINGCIVKPFWIPYSEPFLVVKTAEVAAKTSTVIPLRKFKQKTVRKITLLTLRKGNLKLKSPYYPLPLATLESIDVAIGKITPSCYITT